ncbi:MAG TPA: tetratricopeptide repeat protein, partial [Planctomycetaceae bacterium]|nr:tetratricopeptide repeat protein [Planctomycetaceae bacterium]
VGQAERILQHNLTLDAMHQPTYHTLAQVMIDQGRSGEAYQMVQTWSATQPYVPEAHIEMAWIERETGNPQAAEMALRQALRAEPGHPVALAQLGQIYQEAGQPQQAATLYHQSLAANSNQPAVQAKLAQLSTSPQNNMMSGRGPLPPPVYGGSTAPMMSSGPMMPMHNVAMRPAPAPMMSSPARPIPAPPGAIQPIPQAMSPAPALAQRHGWAPTPRPAAPARVAPPRPAPVIHSQPTAAIAPVPAPVVSSSWQPVGSTTSGPALSGNADPAHTEPAIEMTAALPTVEAH